MPGFARRFAVYWGNITNAETMNITVLEKLGSTRETEAGWLRRKTAMGWSVELMGQAAFDTMRLEYAICCYNYWETFRVYELSASLYRRATDTLVPSDAVEFKDDSVWNAFFSLAQKNADLKSDLHFPKLVHNMYTLFTGLRIDAPEWLPRLMLMCLRTNKSFATSRLCPGGLGQDAIIKKLTSEDVAKLLVPMRKSEAIKHLETGLDIHEEVEKESKKQKSADDKVAKETEKKAQAKSKSVKGKKKDAKADQNVVVGSSGTKRSITVASSSSCAQTGSLVTAELSEVLTDDDKDKCFLQHLTDFWKFLLSKDVNQKDEISEFINLCLAGNFMPTVPLNNKPIKGFKLLRKLIKIDVYHVGKLPMSADLGAMDEDLADFYGTATATTERQ